MLRDRVLLQPLAGGDHRMIWDRELPAKRADSLLKEYRELSWSTQKFGERMEPIEGGHQADFTFMGDQFRVW